MMRRGAAAWRRRTLIPPAPSAINGELPGGAVNETYAEQLTASPAGALPVVWTISSGALPSGWALNPSTGAIGGVATGTGSFTFTVRATNLGGYFERSFTVGIGALSALLHCDGSNGATSTIDAVGGTTWSRTGTSTLSTAQARFGASSILPASGNFGATKAGLNRGTVDFCIDMWIRPAAGDTTGFTRIWQQGANGAAGSIRIRRTGSSGFTALLEGGGGTLLSPQINVPAAQWSHIYIARKSGQWGAGIHGVWVAGSSDSYSTTATDAYIGSNSTNGEYFRGHIDEVRVMEGAVRWWGADFTPPASPSDFPVVP